MAKLFTQTLDERSASITEEDISAAILELERLLLIKVIWNGGNRWPLVLRQTLGTVDGNDLAKEIREMQEVSVGLPLMRS